MFPVPLLTIYSATKVNSFFRKLWRNEKEELFFISVFKWKKKKRKIPYIGFRRAKANEN